MSHIPTVVLRSPGRPETIVCVWPGEEALQGAGAITQTLASLGFSCYIHNRSHSSLLIGSDQSAISLYKVTPQYIKYQIIGIGIIGRGGKS